MTAVNRVIALAAVFILLAPRGGHCHAAPKTAPVPAPVLSPQLQRCLQRADDLPDIAAAESEAWVRSGGGNDAHLCRAFAQSNRGMHEDAAREFWYLAAAYKKKDPARAVQMHDMAGREFMRAQDYKNADRQYARAMAIDPRDSDALIGQAETRMQSEHYWDAISDLNRVLKTDPDNIEALRQRGRAWAELGDDRDAREDLTRAANLEGGGKTP